MALDRTAIIRGSIILLLVFLGLVWFIVRSIRHAQDPAQILVKWLITVPVAGLGLAAVPVIGVPGLWVLTFSAVILSYLWTPHIGAAVAKPFTSLFDGGDLPPEPKPFYSVALARQKRGRYLEAIAEIRKQLERFPTDVEGQLLLAQIQAENLQDLQAAELTISRFCAQPGHAPANIAFALYSLADWHLQFGPDREAAQRALEQVLALLPDTEFALTAAQRIAHLGHAELLLSPHDRKKFTVTEGPKNLGLISQPEPPKADETGPAQQAAQCVKHLEQHPLDTEARERLAGIYAEHYQRLDLATEQLEWMIQQPNQPARLVVRWLNLLADLQVRAGADYETVKATLQRIIDRAPELAAAQTARNRIDRLRLELRANEKSPAVKLGSYEQNLGLKQGRNPNSRSF